ncbi:MAG: DUF2059 domain-containing protein [Rhodospirillales bacterium]|nr:DUF2059 domain-containing protein [Rhodospirillales bacterium]
MLKLIAGTLTVIIVLAVHPAQAIEQGKRDDLVKLFFLSGTTRFLDQLPSIMSQQMRGMIKNKVPKISEEHLNIINEEITREFKSSLSGFLDLMIPLYDKAFSHQEIKDMIVFYETPTGRKLNKILPDLAQAGMALGQQWGGKIGRRAGERAAKRIRGLGYEL